jgi:hypothetical protein
MMGTSIRGMSTLMSTYDSQAEIPKEVVQPLAPHERTKALIALQSFEGSFPLTATLAAILEIPIAELEAKIKGSRGNSGFSDGLVKDVWATMLAITMFERKLATDKGVWEMVVEKAKLWVTGLNGLKVEDIKKLETLAGEVCGH